MSLLFDAGRPAAQPQTHVLAIGVGDYAHLPGGSQEQTAAARQSYGLQSLDSPAWSAVAFASWLGTNLQNRRAPLGTIDLLVVPGATVPPTPTAHVFERPTMRAIAAAFERWVQRCDTHADNVAIFYFCGHGFQREVMMLLPADVGDPAVGVVWNNIIDFTTTHVGMIDCRAGTQLYLIDACRDTPHLLLRDFNGHPTPLKTTTTLQHPRRNAPVLQAGTTGTRTHGVPGQVSFFTKALIECIARIGARAMNGTRWEVSTNSLGVALQHYMPRLKISGIPPLSCDTVGQSNFDSVIHEFTGDAEVLASIDCLPDEALDAATFAIAAAGAMAPQQYVANGERVELQIKSGQYEVEATFAPGAAWQPKRQSQMMMPPCTSCTLEVSP